jgi:hypothetical protein
MRAKSNFPNDVSRDVSGSFCFGKTRRGSNFPKAPLKGAIGMFISSEFPPRQNPVGIHRQTTGALMRAMSCKTMSAETPRACLADSTRLEPRI